MQLGLREAAETATVVTRRNRRAARHARAAAAPVARRRVQAASNSQSGHGHISDDKPVHKPPQLLPDTYEGMMAFAAADELRPQAASSSSAYDSAVMDELQGGEGLQALYSRLHEPISSGDTLDGPFLAAHLPDNLTPQLPGTLTSMAGAGSSHNSTQQQRAHSPAPLTREPKYKTVMLKVSGEALQGKQGFGVDPEVLTSVAAEVAEAVRHGVRMAIVVGGGNYFRGASAWKGLERATADYVGMLATVMNALCLQGALESMGVETRVQTAIEMREVAEPYIRRRAISHLKAGRVVIFGAGTGNPFFTTDTAAALRAAEVNAEVFLKATKVDGVYDCDPAKHPHARRYNQLSYRQVSLDRLQVMDETAITLCKENTIPVIVFNIMGQGNILKAALGEPVGTVVCDTVDSSLAEHHAPAHLTGPQQVHAQQ